MTDATVEPDAEAEPAPLNRTISPIAGRFAAGRKGKALVLAGLAAGCGAFALATSHAGLRKPHPPPDQPARQVVAFEPAAPPTLDRPGDAAPSLTGSAPAVGGVGGDRGAFGATATSTKAAADPAAAIRAAPLLAYGAGLQGESLPGPSALDAIAGQPAQAATELEQLRRGSAIGESRARRLGDRSFLILAGTSIPCLLQTALDSSTPGYVSCVVPQDVYSENGATVLLDKGSKVLGEYRASLKPGQARLFVLWTRAVTPNGVAIDLASPASDALGRAGFDGDLDRHFWERFGGALLLSIIDGASTGLVARGGEGDIVRLPSDAASVALGHSVDVGPTLRKPQGAEVAIFAAQDFDFSGVYALRAR